MHLTKEEEHIYDGESGWANEVSMKILVRLGELFNATKLTPINSAHASGVSYKTLGDAPIDFLEAFSKSDAKVKVKATLNPQSFDEKYLRRKLPFDLHHKQSKVLDYFKKMGFVESFTCTPYYLEDPKRGSHLAWSESSAVLYANSVVGAWTNREGGPSALAAAVIGKTPNYGIHQAENRQPKVTIKLTSSLRNETEFGALGIFLGKILADRIPTIRDLGTSSKEELKQLGAALASTGMTNMFYYGKTDVKIGETETISVETGDLKRTVESLTTASKRKPDLVFLGCPHCSLSEMEAIADLIGDRKVKEGTELWVCTSRHVKRRCGRCVEIIEKSGGHVLTDTCAVVTWTDKLGIETIMTNSAKTAHYAPTLNRAETILAPQRECLDAALK